MAQLRTTSPILGMMQQHLIDLQTLSIPLTMKKRWADGTRASGDNRIPRNSGDEDPKATQLLNRLELVYDST